MDIEIFQKSFQIRDINIKPYFIVVSIFITFILMIVFFNNKIEDYYICNGKVLDQKVIIYVNNEELKKITENEKIIIERNIFTYKVEKINEVINNNTTYYELTLEFDRIPNHLFINNNIVELKFIVNRMTIFDYLIKTLKGE